MRKKLQLSAALVLLIHLFACNNDAGPFVPVDDLSPWCIRGFDAKYRTPEQRIKLLKDMGFQKYGYNKGDGNLSHMKQEFGLATKNSIEITSIFLWLNASRDSIGKLSRYNQLLLSNLKLVNQKPTIWVSFSPNFYKNRSDSESLEYTVEMIRFIKTQADELGCKIALYNHNGWFGNPYNQVKIIEELNDESISIVFNFHHAHDYIEEFAEIAKLITPYLSYVNLNGMEKEGPQILAIGKGHHELEMIEQLKEEGYNGPWGILGHVKTADVRVVLEGNMEGLKVLNARYQNENLKRM